jgi:hypothetical protein
MVQKYATEGTERRWFNQKGQAFELIVKNFTKYTKNR